MAEEVETSARTFTKLYFPDKNGIRWYDELSFLEASKGIRDPRLDEAVPPEEASFVFNLYWHRFRTTGLSYTEIKAYQEISGIVLEQWDIELLFLIHNTAEKTLSEMYKQT